MPGIRPGPLDPGVLAEFSEGDAALERQVLSEFMRANAEDVARVERAVEAGDAARVAREIHRLKGAASAIGAQPLADACTGLEAAARSGDWEAIVARRQDLRHEAARLEAHLQSLAGAS